MSNPLAAVTFLSIVAVASALADDVATVGSEAATEQRLSAALRDRNATIDRQVAAVRELAALGEAGPRAWCDHVARETSRLAGTTAAAENIFMCSASGPDAVKAWFLSPGHHKNLLGDGHRRQGLGCSGRHWTQLFGD